MFGVVDLLLLLLFVGFLCLFLVLLFSSLCQSNFVIILIGKREPVVLADVLGQMWCLIVSIPDLCFLSNFYDCQCSVALLHGGIVVFPDLICWCLTRKKSVVR